MLTRPVDSHHGWCVSIYILKHTVDPFISRRRRPRMGSPLNRNDEREAPARYIETLKSNPT